MKNIWKIITGTAVVVSLAATMFTVSDRIAWAADVEQSLSIMGQGIQLQIDTQQLDAVTDRKYLVRRRLEANPNDQDAKDEMEYLKRQVEVLRDRIKKNTMALGKGE